VYRREGPGFLLYSIGPDLKDNGGAERTVGSDEKYDIVWRMSK